MFGRHRRIALFGLGLVVAIGCGVGLWPAPAAAAPDGADDRPAPGMKARVYQLKHRDADDVLEALRPLMSDARGAMMRKSEELGTITARDFPENLAAIEQAVKRLDVAKPPQPDVEVSIRILIGSPASGQSQYPGDLESVVKQLGTTLSYKSYHQIAAVTQRLRAGAGTSGKGEIAVAPPVSDDKTAGHFHYNVENAGVPAVATGGAPVITLRRFKLRLEGGGLGEAEVSTGLTLREGEKVVVGTGSLKSRAMIVVVAARVLR